MQDKYVLPLVDISLLNSPNLDDRMQVAQALDQACQEVGFLYLKGDQFQHKHYSVRTPKYNCQCYVGLQAQATGYGSDNCYLAPMTMMQFVYPNAYNRLMLDALR